MQRSTTQGFDQISVLRSVALAASFRSDLSRVVVALGGNAFARPNEPLTMAGQFEFARRALSQLRPVLEPGAPLVIVHGNGPQVGYELVRVEAALGKAYAVPLDVCVAESEGELGYVLAQSLREVLSQWGQSRAIVSVLTQVVVAADDPAFATPSKPIGAFYSAEQAEVLRQRGFHVREDAGRGYRRVVPSPCPREIVEGDVVRQLLDLGVLVIAAGGGGIPVVRHDGVLRGVEAVVDKDLSAALLAHELDARDLVILTDVPCAYRDFGTPQQAVLGRVTCDELRALASAGHFAAGSMLPKIEAAIQFVDRPQRRAFITSVDGLPDAWDGRAGTIVEADQP